MSDAIQLALLKNHELQSFSIEIRAREARTLQESFAPNPEIEFEVENFGGSGELSDFNGSEITLSVGQLSKVMKVLQNTRSNHLLRERLLKNILQEAKSLRLIIINTALSSPISVKSGYI